MREQANKLIRPSYSARREHKRAVRSSLDACAYDMYYHDL